MAPIGRTVKQPQPAIIQWDNGRGKWRDVGDARWSQWPNFHAETGRNEEFDRAMHAAGVPRIEFFHPAKNGRQATVTQDWVLGTFIGLHPITAGPPADKVSSITLDPAMMAAAAEAGIGLRWLDGEKSSMAVRGFLALPNLADGVTIDPDKPETIRTLLLTLAEERAAGQRAPITWTVIPVPVQLGVSSNTSDVLMDALVDHRRVCEAADAFRDNRPEEVTFHELVLPLVLGREVEWASRDPRKGGSTTTVYTFASAHLGTITKPYVRGMWRKPEIHKQAESLFAGIQLWAQRYQRNGGLPQEASFDDGGDGAGSQETPAAGRAADRPTAQPASSPRSAPVAANGGRTTAASARPGSASRREELL